MKKTNRMLRFLLSCSVVLLLNIGASNTVYAKPAYGDTVFNDVRH